MGTEHRKAAADYIRQWRGMVWGLPFPERPRGYRIIREAARRIYGVDDEC